MLSNLATHLPEVFPLPLQNHFLVVVQLTTAAGSWIPQYLCEGRRRGKRRRRRRRRRRGRSRRRRRRRRTRKWRGQWKRGESRMKEGSDLTSHTTYTVYISYTTDVYVIAT